MDITAVIAKEQNLQLWQAQAVVKLIDEGNTIPFIARYRKEAHGAMNDEQLRDFDERLRYLRGLEERKQSVLGAIEEQGKLTPELQAAIEAAMTQTAVEDIYRPYKQKRRTRAIIAREKGLEPLALYILDPSADHAVEKEAAAYVDPEKEIPDADTAIHMAEDIIAEQVSDNADYRAWIREKTGKEGILVTEQSRSAKKEEKAGGKAAGETTVNKKLAQRADVYTNYYEYQEQVSKIPGHRILAINRGENEKFLTVRIDAPVEDILAYLYRKVLADNGASVQNGSEAPKNAAGQDARRNGKNQEQPKREKAKQVNSLQDLRLLADLDTGRGAGKGGKNQTAAVRKKDDIPKVRENSFTSAFIKEAVEDAYKRLIAPSIETEIRGELTAKAEEGAMKVFSGNLTQLLMQAPVQGKVVLGWDPAFRTGCKLAVVDATGKVLTTTVIYPTEPQNKIAEAQKVLYDLCRTYSVDLISVGNGTASRESEQVIVDFIKKSKLPVKYVIVNEAGASVYSASKLATEEFPNFDVGQRSAASIARRLQDPLAELVKIDPKAIGVGQYQHDMNQTKLGETLTAVVEDCVNRVGVDVNTASAALLSYISGINRTIAKNIVEYREQNGRFVRRKDLLKVSKLGPKAYEQCAGFLRIRGGSEPLDMTGVHPESYPAAEILLHELQLDKKDISNGQTAVIRKRMEALSASDKEALAQKTGAGEFTLQDIITELEKPGRDPREDVTGPVLRSDVLDMKDLKPDMVLTGTVRNVVDFGVFVDIGVHQDGLVHISQICDRFIKHPLDAVKVGDIVRVKVLGVDEKKNRISLTMKGIDK